MTTDTSEEYPSMGSPTFQDPSTDAFLSMFGPDLEPNSNEIPLTFTLYGFSHEKGMYVEESHDTLIHGDEEVLRLSSPHDFGLTSPNHENWEFEADLGNSVGDEC